tara:strand:- start:555 stop:3125 length:2571 start_codon:yes stop_codon:yes gene_type:complete
MSVIKSNGAGSAAKSFYNDVATQSLRFDSANTAYLYRTNSSNSNRKKFTWSGWLKKSVIFASTATANQTYILSGGAAGGNPIDAFYFDGQALSGLNLNRLSNYFYMGNSSSHGSYVDYSQETTMQFQDVAQWYHIVLAVDTSQSTASNRVKYYVNGTQQTDTSQYYAQVPQNMDTSINNNVLQNIGRSTDVGDSRTFEGYMAEVNFVDGYQYDASYFGETKNGVWIAKKYTGSYGTNGYRLEFKNTSVGSGSSSTIGADTSGNDNHWTSSGIAASDCNIPDSPENNFCTMNPLVNTNGASGAFSEGNLKITKSGTTYSFFQSTFGFKKGKWYAEIRCNSFSQYRFMVGIAEMNMETYMTGSGNDPHSTAGTIFYDDSGYGHYDGSGVAINTFSGGVGFGAGNVIGLALDMDSSTQTIKFYKDGSLVTTKDLPASAIDHMGFACNWYDANVGVWNFGQDSTFAGEETATSNSDGNGNGLFHTSVPSGYLAACTANFTDDDDALIGPNSDTQAGDHFNTVLWTGNATDRDITDVGFKPDWVWTKSRSASNSHYLFNSTRGVLKDLEIDNNDAESTEADSLEAFLSNGFSLGTNNNTNANTVTFVGWNWKANGGTTTTNDASATGVGSRDSVYQANTTAGFSIVTYDGDSSDQNGTVSTIAHGLGAVPKWILFKPLDNFDGAVYHAGNTSAPETERLILFSSSGNLATGDDAGFFNDTAPTSTVFTIGPRKHVNSNGGMIAFCFAEIEGYSKFGSYTANNGTNNAFVYTGFRPAFVMIKATAVAQEWAIIDNVRDTFNDASSNVLYPNYQNAESTDGSNIVDFLSNGFKIRATASVGYLTGVYVYMAFAEAPFKYANAR